MNSKTLAIAVAAATAGMLALGLARSLQQHDHDHVLHSVEQRALAEREPIVLRVDRDREVKVYRALEQAQGANAGGVDPRED